MSTEPLSCRVASAVDLSSFTLSGGLPKEAGVGATARPVSMTPEPSAMSTENQVSLPPNRRSSLTDLEFVPGWQGLSAWSGSLAKRIFDCACVLLSAPVVLPLMLITALTVRLTSPGPVFFLQERIGRFGRPFTIFKFRTMMHTVGTPHRPIAIPDSSCFTSVGPFLRRWKLDELPQLINVLLGHMSLVGPRPKMREHVRYDLPCRPGITGMATIVFACEEDILASLAKDQVEEYFHAVVLPAKRRLDANYMSRATFLSDLQLLVNSVLRRWDSRALEEIAVAAAFGIKQALAPETGYRPVSIARQKPKPIRTEPTADAEEVTLM